MGSRAVSNLCVCLLLWLTGVQFLGGLIHVQGVVGKQGVVLLLLVVLGVVGVGGWGKVEPGLVMLLLLVWGREPGGWVVLVRGLRVLLPMWVGI